MTRSLEAGTADPGSALPPRWPTVAVYGALFVLPLIPYALFYVTRGYLLYTNGWDEEHYLSYQAATALADVPGYWSANLVVLLHRLGIGGGVQNLLFDAVVPLAVFLLIAAALRRVDVPRPWARLYAALFLFGTLFFNQANPWVEWLNARGLPGLVSAVARFPPVMRSPNPQLGFLLAALGVWLYVRYRRWWLLLVPVPPMYWAVGVPYVYGVVSAALYAWRRPRRLAATLALGVVPFVAVAASASLAFALLRRWLRGFDATRFAQPNMTPLVPVPLLFSLTALLVVLLVRRSVTAHAQDTEQVDSLNLLAYATASCCACLLMLANLQLFVGAGLNPPGIQDAVGVAIAAISLALAIEAARRLRWPVARWWPAAFRGALLLTLVWMLAQSQGFQPQQLRFRVYVGPQIAQAGVEHIRADPLRAIVPHETLRGRLTLLAPQIRAVPLAHEYNKNALLLQCSGYQELMARALESVDRAAARGELTAEQQEELHAAYALFRSKVALLDGAAFVDAPEFCGVGALPRTGFWVAELQDPAIWRWFPRR